MSFCAYSGLAPAEREKLGRQLDEAQLDYNRCMLLIRAHSWRHRGRYVDHLRDGLLFGDVEAYKVDACRTFAKAFWGTALRYIEAGNSPGEREVFRTRHRQFVHLVRPLDKALPEDQADDPFSFLYSFPGTLQSKIKRW